MLEGIVGIACTVYAYKRIYFEDNRFDEKLPEKESRMLVWSGQVGSINGKQREQNDQSKREGRM